ncbi:MAG: alkaline phosphatase family protein [Actinomycetales bacterium]|nr:alkaline phosphatase family protein [Actinomycetales bacterium]
MLPAARSHRFRLAEVVPNCLDALAGRRSRLGLAPVTHAVVVLVDGLGQELLEASAGHARTLAGRLGIDKPLDTGFPTTTASSLASLTTGADPGAHGLVGYSVLDPEADRVVNLLNGWAQDGDPAGPDAHRWQPVPTLFESSAADGVTSVAIAPERFRGTGFTTAVLRGAEFRGASTLAERFAALRTELAAPGPRLIYLYVAELDAAGHARGVASSAWVEALEAVDAEIAGALRALGPRHGLVVTADHGMLDVPHEAHRLVAPELLAGVAHVAGEPRALQLHLDAGVEADPVADRWRASEGAKAWIATRAEAEEAGWFGEVAPAIRPRIGDVLVLARAGVAYYLDEDAPSRGMVGQHGSLTTTERTVPLLRFGAWA